ncbi:MAG: ParB/RepB/Spo0J family partition protein [Pseudomonadota bacterium]
MAENRRGLGRGLSALLGEAEEISHAVDPAEGVREIPIELINRNPEQPRRHFDPAEIAELSESIRDKGVLQPILVRPSPVKPGEYEIVAGERRWRASQQAGLIAIPALVRALDDDRAYEIAIVENVQRTDLNPLEEAQAYAVLVNRFGHTQEQIAQAVGKSRSHVANTMRLSQLPEAVQALVMEGKLTAGHARALLTADNAEALAEQVVGQGLSVRETETLARGEKTSAAPKKASGPRKSKDADTEALEADLEDALGLSVDIADRGGAGEVRIRYASLEQLDEICRRLTRQ